MTTLLRAEDRFLLACSRPNVDLARALDATRAGLDWRYVVDASIRHAVAPLLANAVDSAQELHDLMPGAVQRELDELRTGTGTRTTRLFGVVAEIVDAFDGEDVDVLGLKDLQLAAEVYPSRSLRPMGDVDLLVRRDDWRAATGALATIGFEPVPGPNRRFTERFGAGQQYRRPTDETWIDLQWHVAEREWDRDGSGRYTFDTDRIWRRAVPLEIAGRQLLAPCPVDMLLHLCLHLEGHEYCELVLFADIVAFLDRYRDTLDWDALIELAHASGAASATHQVLDLTARLFDAAPPAGVLDRLRPAYFQGSLTRPLYGNLTTLHLSLDDIAETGAPPEHVLDEAAAVVREQAQRAMRIEAWLDEVAVAARAEGARLVVFDGASSARRFPDRAIAAFPDIDLFVLESDLPAVERAVAAAGPCDGVRTITSPSLADALMPPTTPSKRRAAIGSLRARVTRRAAAPDTATLVVRPLPPEALVVVLAARAGTDLAAPLFDITNLLHALAADLVLDAATVARLAAQHGVEAAVADALAVADGIAATPATSDLLGPLPRRPVPLILRWARYGPDTSHETDLRFAYLAALTLMQARGVSERFRYARSAGSVLGRGARRLLDRKRPVPSDDARAFAYWIEPAEPVSAP